MIKFFVKEGKYRFILSGSLLGVELSGLKSFPVGYLKTINMFPLDFEEFLIASGASISLLNQIKKSFDSKKSVPLTLHNKILSLFYRYLIVGGMPQVVSSFLLTNDLNVTYDIQQNIIQNYLMDFSQYEKSQRLKLMNLYKLIPSQLDDKNKRYQFNIINANIRFDRYEDSFNWLIDAGVALPTYNVTEITLPLIRSKKSNLFKLFLSDVGLLASMFGKSTILKLFNNDGSINNGAIFENFIACELICHHFSLYYANHKRYGEIDFLIEYQGELLPLEIKSGKDYKTHRALSNYLSLGFAKKGFVFSNYGEIEVINNITYYPIYMIMFLTNDIDLGIVEPVRFY